MSGFFESGATTATTNGHEVADPPVRPLPPGLRELPEFGDLFDLRAMEAPEPLVHGLLNKNSIVMLSGAPGTGKSFIALGMSLAIAAPDMGMWEQYPVRSHGDVLYIAAEGGGGMWERVAAWCEANGISPDRVRPHWYPTAFNWQLGSAYESAVLMERIRVMRPALVVVDTKARCTDSSDENDSTSQASVIRVCDTIRQETGACVLVIHHSTRSGANPRGSSAWDGAVDIDLRIVCEGEGSDRQLIVKCHKRKDEEDQCSHWFRLAGYGIRSEWRRTLAAGSFFDNAHSRVAVSVVEDSEGQGDTSGHRTRALGILDDLGGTTGLSRTQWVRFAEQGGISESEMFRVIGSLEKTGHVAKEGHNFKKLRDL